MSFQKRCSHLIMSGWPRDQNSGLTRFMLKPKQLSQISPKPHSSPIPAPKGMVEARPVQPLDRLPEAGQEGPPEDTAAGLSASGCLLQEHQWARTDMGTAELLWDSKGKPRRAGVLQHVCITVTARTDNPSAPVDREMERPGCEQ